MTRTLALVAAASAALALGATACETGDDAAVRTEHTAPQDQERPKEPETGGGDAVVFKVWGKAAYNVKITYSTDSDMRDGKGPLPFRAEMKYNEDALYYAVNAQLGGGGDIYCSVTYKGHTAKGHASGSYNICSAQLNAGLFGGISE